MAASFAFPLQVAKAGLRPAARLLRAIPVHAEVMRQSRRQGPRLVFLPAYGPEGAALLRIYGMAEALQAFGWQSLVLPPGLTLAQRLAFLRRIDPDVVVMQGARHALNRPALYRDWRIVFDMDDADFHLPHLSGPVRRAMADVAAVIAGSAYVADWCRLAGARDAHVVWTGTPVSARPRTPQSARPPVVAWAQTRPMTYRGEAALVARVMRALAARRPGVTLRLYDRRLRDDPGFAASFAAPGLTVEWREAMDYSAYLESFDDVAIGLAPLSPDAPFARGKSFGKILAYLDRKVPVIGSREGEHGAFFTAETGVITNDPEAWVTALDHLLGDGAARQAMAEAAYEAFSLRLSREAAAEQVSAILMGVVRGQVARSM